MQRAHSIDALSEASNESDVGMGLQLVVHSNDPNEPASKRTPMPTEAARPTSPLNPRRAVSLGAYDLQKAGNAASAALRRVRHQHQRLASTEEETLATSYDSSNSLQRNDESMVSFQSTGRRPRSRKHTHLEDEFSRNVEQETFYVVPDEDDQDVFDSHEVSDIVLKINQADLDSSLLAPLMIPGGIESVV
jgi:hypothetical protein